MYVYIYYYIYIYVYVLINMFFFRFTQWMLVSDIIGPPGWHRHADLASEVVGSLEKSWENVQKSEIHRKKNHVGKWEIQGRWV